MGKESPIAVDTTWTICEVTTEIKVDREEMTLLKPLKMIVYWLVMKNKSSELTRLD